MENTDCLTDVANSSARKKGRPETLSEAYEIIKDDEKRELDELRQKFSAIFKRVPQKSAGELCSTTKTLISFVQARIQEWNQTRTSSLQISLGLFSFSVLGLALEANNLGKLHVYLHFVSIGFLFALLCTSLIYFCILSKQVSFAYPFIPVAKTWRWFFLYTMSNKMPFPMFLRENDKKLSRELFLKGLINYSEDTIDMHLNPVSELEQDLEQLYLLLIYEGYMFQFARKANDKLRLGIIISVTLPIFSLVVMIVLQSFMTNIDLFQWFRGPNQ